MYGVVLFLFCSCLPSTGLLSAFSSLHGMLHSFPLLGIFHLFFPSCFTAPTGSLLPLGDVGDYWVGHLFPPHPREQLRIVPSSEFSQVFSLLASKHSESQPTGVPTPDVVFGRGRRVVACSDYLGPSLFPVMPSKSLHIGSIHVCVSLSLFFFFSSSPFSCGM